MGVWDQDWQSPPLPQSQAPTLGCPGTPRARIPPHPAPLEHLLSTPPSSLPPSERTLLVPLGRWETQALGERPLAQHRRAGLQGCWA